MPYDRDWDIGKPSWMLEDEGEKRRSICSCGCRQNEHMNDKSGKWSQSWEAAVCQGRCGRVCSGYVFAHKTR
jgi:hypothetical protein